MQHRAQEACIVGRLRYKHILQYFGHEGHARPVFFQTRGDGAEGHPFTTEIATTFVFCYCDEDATAIVLGEDLILENAIAVLPQLFGGPGIEKPERSKRDLNTCACRVGRLEALGHMT